MYTKTSGHNRLEKITLLVAFVMISNTDYRPGSRSRVKLEYYTLRTELEKITLLVEFISNTDHLGHGHMLSLNIIFVCNM